MRITKLLRDELDRLIWRFFDQIISPTAFKRLESLLRRSDEARRMYVERAWLHSALFLYFAEKSGRKPAGVAVASDRFLGELLSSPGVNEDEAREQNTPRKRNAGTR